jgi:hypothetical protein
MCQIGFVVSVAVISVNVHGALCIISKIDSIQLTAVRLHLNDVAPVDPSMGCPGFLLVLVTSDLYLDLFNRSSGLQKIQDSLIWIADLLFCALSVRNV